jgi:hypothetical protein
MLAPDRQGRRKESDMRVTLRFAEMFKIFGVAPCSEIEVERECVKLHELVALATAQDENVARAMQLSVRESSESSRPAAVFYKDGRAMSPDTEICGDTEITVLLPVAGG